MTNKIRAALRHYEHLTEEGSIATFAVYIQGDGILIKPPGAEAGQQVPLIEEMLTLLHAYFYDMECIEYGTFDYASLKSFLNASPEAGKTKE